MEGAEETATAASMAQARRLVVQPRSSSLTSSRSSASELFKEQVWLALMLGYFITAPVE